jgi:hypothetical protein
MTNIMTNEELQAIRERCEKATPGPWRTVGKKPGYEVEMIVAGDYADEGEPDLVVEVWASADNKADAEFIAHAREDVPKLLDEVKELREINDWLRKENAKLSNGLHEVCEEVSYLRAVLDEYKKCEEEYASDLCDAYAENKRLREALEHILEVLPSDPYVPLYAISDEIERYTPSEMDRPVYED